MSNEERRALEDQFAFPSVSPNDLRRTTQLGSVSTALNRTSSAPHGHTDSRMVEQVYGRLPVDSLGRLLAEHVGEVAHL